MQKITNGSIRAALFFRGFIEEMESGADKLRQCQEEGSKLVEEFLEKPMTVPHLRKLSNLLQQEGVIDKYREGKHYSVTKGENYDEMVNFLDENPDWGNTDGKDEEEKIWQRVRRARGYVKGMADDRIPGKVWKILYQLLDEGELEIMFYPAGKKVGYVEKKNGKTRLVQPQLWKGIVKDDQEE